jgi:hypothetical protein
MAPCPLSQGSLGAPPITFTALRSTCGKAESTELSADYREWAVLFRRKFPLQGLDFHGETSVKLDFDGP